MKINRSFFYTGRKVCVCLLASAALAGAIFACQVPVFRYALERWNPDRYQVFVLSDGPLNSEQSAALQPLIETPEKPGSVDLKLVDIAKANDKFVAELWKKHNTGTGPVVVALYPQTASTPPDQVAHAVALSQQHVQWILNSPAREEIGGRLVDGHSAVWVFVKSGDSEKDETAFQTLKTQLEKDAEWLKLPTVEELEVDPKVVSDTRIKLRIEFSIVSIQRDDPQEQFLLDCLLNSKSDLRSFNEPIAFPVFGRGRALYALVGLGIAEDTIRTASSFVTGPCSCQVKNQNPGFDLLLNRDWDAAVGEIFISQPVPEPDSKPVLLTIPPGRKSR